MTNDDVDFSTELEQYLEEHDYDMPKPGDIRKGVIVANTNEGVIIDLGLKRDGIVPPSDLAKLSDKERESLEVDKEISVYIMETSQPDTLHVSIHRALLNEDWIVVEEVMEQGEIVEAEVVGYNRGGALVDYGRLRGFIPMSQLSAFRPGMKDRDKQRVLSKMRGEILPLKVIEVDRRRRRLVMSNREAQREWDETRRAERIKELQAGTVVTGQVSSLRDFGAFVDLGGGLEGLVHVSELSWHRIDHPQEVVKSGEEIEVYILKVDEAQQRVSLSRKRLLPDPWTTVEDKYPPNTLVEGKITRIVNYGAFVELEPGIEGLLHSSKMLRGSDNADPFKVVQEGEVHLLRVINVDADRQRIGLSLRAVTPQEQIEWMMQSEAEAEAAAEVEEDEESVPAKDEAAADETGTAVAEAVAEVTESAVETAEAAVEAAQETAADSAEAVVETAAEATESAVETTETAVEAAQETAADSAEVVVEAVAEVTESAVETAETAVEAAQETAADSAEAVVEAVAKATESAVETAETAVEAAQETAADSAEAVVEAVAKATESAVETAETAVEAAQETAADSAEAVVEAVAKATESAVETAETAVEAAQETAADSAEAVAETVEEVTESAVETAKTAVEAAQETAADSAEAVAETVEEVTESALETAKTAVEAAQETAADSAEAVAETAAEATESAVETAEAAVEAAQETAADSAEAVVETVEEVTESAVETASEVIDDASQTAEEAVAAMVGDTEVSEPAASDEEATDTDDFAEQGENLEKEDHADGTDTAAAGESAAAEPSPEASLATASDDGEDDELKDQ